MKKHQSWNKPEVKVNRLNRKEKFMSFMLFDLLSCITPHPNYARIRSVIKQYIPKKQEIYIDGVGNIIVKVGTNYTTMFSCHIDMIFRQVFLPKEESIADTERKLDLFIAEDQEHSDANFVWGGIITEFKKGKHIYTPTTLGADDKAGIYILLSLIKAEVPGLYIFHMGEELGGIGSSDIVTRSPNLVKGIKRAIAFDRMDYFDIIASQRGGVCCSQTFVKAFANQLDKLILAPCGIPGKYESAVGSFTDTANYIHLIPECTNLSVGYFSQHSAEECLDTFWLEDVITPGLLKVDWESLPTERIITPKYKSLPDFSNNYKRKYTNYPDIDYMTKKESLPPWNLQKGLIKSCNDIGMRRLIKNYVETVKSEFVIHEDILKLLKENAVLKAKIEGNYTNVIPLLGPVKSSNGSLFDLKSRQKTAFNAIANLLVVNFRVYDDNFNSYKETIAQYGELVKWAWKEQCILPFDSLSQPDAQLKLMRTILSEIVVINTTLIGESQYNLDGSILQSGADSE